MKIAEIAFENNCFNASASRAYYAAFHAAIASIYSLGIEPRIEHKSVHAIFADNYVNRRKIIPSKYKRYLMDLQDIRNSADYRVGVGKKDCKTTINTSKRFCRVNFKDN